MTDTSRRLSIRADRPVDPVTGAILREVDTVMRRLEVSYRVVGATARDLLLFHVHGVRQSRATRDVDFAFAVSGWDEFERIRSALLALEGSSQDANGRHRLWFRHLEAILPIDLIPYGDIASPDGTIRWPPGFDHEMRVDGFADAARAYVDVTMSEELEVPVVDLAGLCALKLLAWRDRGHASDKDAQDVLLLARTYGDPVNHERLYSDEFELLEAADYDLELAGVRLLGRDVARIVSRATHLQLATLLLAGRTRDRLHAQMTSHYRGAVEHGAWDRVDALVSAFAAGLAEPPGE